MLGLIVFSSLLGLIVAIVTTVLLTEEKSKTLPGGSILVAVLFAFAQHQQFAMVVLCAIAGCAGWFVFHYIFIPGIQKLKKN